MAPLPFQRTIFLCVAIAVGTIAAAVLSAIDVESIVASLPLLACAGVILGIVAFRYASLHLMLFALYQPAVLAAVVTLIIGFEWSPHEADPIVFLLGVNAIFCTMWAFALVIRLLTTPPRLPAQNRGLAPRG